MHFIALYILAVAIASVGAADTGSPTPTSSPLPVALPGTPPLAEQCGPVRDCVAALRDGKPCAALPVPARSALPPLAPKPVELLPLRRGVWAYRDLAYLSLIARHGSHIALVDFPDSDAGSNKPDGSGTRLTDETLRVLNGTTPTRIDMVYSHGHYDHIGAGTRFADWARAEFPGVCIVVWGTERARQMIEDSASKRAPLPHRIIGGDGETLELSPDLRIEMRPLGGHQGDDLAVYIPAVGDEQAVLLHVDVVFPRWSPFSNFAFSEEVGHFIRVHDALLAYPFDVFVGGHLRLGSRADVAESREYARDILSAARLAKENTGPTDFARAGAAKFGNSSLPQFGDVWFAFVDAGRNVQARTCARLLIAKWGCRLGGMLSTVESHCFVGITYLNLEG